MRSARDTIVNIADKVMLIRSCELGPLPISPTLLDIVALPLKPDDSGIGKSEANTRTTLSAIIMCFFRSRRSRPLASAVATGTIERGVALCGSGVGASIAVNKGPGERVGLIHDLYSAHKGVEDNNVNVFRIDGKVIGSAIEPALIERF